MKIKHKRHKTQSKLFPITLTWEIRLTHILNAGGFHYTARIDDRVFDEDELWEKKHLIERDMDFMFWVTNWDDIEEQLSNGF